MCIRDSSMTEPPLLTAVASATSNFNGFNVSCYGGNNGSGSVTPGGGVAPYTYLWTNNQTTQAANTLSVNTQYSVTVTHLTLPMSVFVYISVVAVSLQT